MTPALRVLAIIPARGGSKGLPGKNIRPLAGKPLLAWSIQAAQNSTHVQEIVVSTDSPEIASVAVEHGSRVLTRPSTLATDEALVADAIAYHLKELADSDEHFDAVALLQPTSPLRPPTLIDDCIEEMLKAGADSIATFSATDVHPEKLWVIEGSHPRPLMAAETAWLPRQAMTTAYQLNGLLYIFRVQTFLDAGATSVLAGTSLAKVTQQFVDIDTLEDFHAAEDMLRTFKDHGRAD